ncbi:MAG TPA: hypothetical protein PK867_08735 [Pirellulales bacterium]|nr:hypothetical protein [Pirellulales bacterium]
MTRWDNRRNLYRSGMLNLVDRMRKEAAFVDDGSTTALPIDFDPLQWRLLPGSAGYQAGPDGQDLGADVSRVATRTPRYTSPGPE